MDVLNALEGKAGETVAIPTKAITSETLKDFVQPDLPDNVWLVGTQLPAEELKKQATRWGCPGVPGRTKRRRRPGAGRALSPDDGASRAERPLSDAAPLGRRRISRRKATPLFAGVALLEFGAMSKVFGATIALRDIDFDARRGPVSRAARRERRRQIDDHQDPRRHLPPDQRRDVHRRPAGRVPTPALLRSIGVHIVHQDSSILPGLTIVAEFRARPGARPGASASCADVPRATILLERGRSASASRSIQTASASSLSIGDRKILEILKVLDARQKLLILDEPTASLTAEESRRLLDDSRRAQGSGHRHPLRYPPPRRDRRHGRPGDGAARRRQGRRALPAPRRRRTASCRSWSDGILVRCIREPGVTWRSARFRTSVSAAERAFEDVSLDRSTRRNRCARRAGRAWQLRSRAKPRRIPAAGRGRGAMDGRPIRLRSMRDALANGIGFLAEDRADTILRVRTVRENLAARERSKCGRAWASSTRGARRTRPTG